MGAATGILVLLLIAAFSLLVFGALAFVIVLAIRGSRAKDE